MDTIGRYKVESELGRGGMAIVYLAVDPNINRQVAIKLLPRELTYDPQFRVRFQREAETIARLEHPSIVPIYDFGTEGEQPFLVMRYMTGGTLAQRLREDKQFSPDEIIEIFEQIAPALHEAHQVGIVHRDLKPDNILFDQRGRAMISDFGIVKLTEASLALTGDAILGTPAYMSPEQVHGKQSLDGRSDLYSLGIILFEMLTGRLPYSHPNPMGQALMHVKLPVPNLAEFAPELPKPYQAVVDRVLAKDREDRPQTALALIRELEQLRPPVERSSQAPQVEYPGLSSPSSAPETVPEPGPKPGPKPYQAPETRTLNLPLQADEPPPVRSKRRFPGWLWGVLGLAGLAGILAIGSFVLRDRFTGAQAPPDTTVSPTANSAGQPPTDVSERPPTASEIPAEVFAPVYKDLDIRPQIWFGPLDPWSWEQYFPGEGPFQFYDLFTPEADWETVSDAVQVIRLHPVWLESYGTTEEIRAVLEDIGRRGMAISYEAGPLTESGPCNAATVEGYWGADAARQIVENIAAAGGHLYAMDLEHPLDAGRYYDARCRQSVEAIAADVANTIAVVRSVFPEVKIGSIETANLDADAVAGWLAAYRDAVGEELDYFHLDVNYSRSDWAARAVEIQEVVRARGIEFGIFYFGNPEADSDLLWLSQAENRIVEFEVLNGGSPDHVIFQSWHPHPQKLFPEGDPDAFTNLVLRYLRPRSLVSLDRAEGNDLVGALTTDEGRPLAGESIEIRVVPVEGEGVFGEYTITGIVPNWAETANTGFRVNHECECNGPAEFVFEQVEYSEDGSRVIPIPNGDFSQGWEFWGWWGDGSVEIVPSSNATGGALALSASPDQFVGLNSDVFPVTPGAEFTVTFLAKISPATGDSGYFALFFLADVADEGSREVLPFSTAEIVFTDIVTDENGGFRLDVTDYPLGEYLVHAFFPGSDANWAAFVSYALAVQDE